MKKLTLHIILNSHLDPIWQWGYANGVDEVIATARSACELLDTYPKIHITRGESWFYETLETHDPDTFRRVKEYVQAGRWHVVGGWYLQPDCNLASEESYRMHAVIARKYFNAKFGIRQVATGYNVDSFGQGGYLPKFYARQGFRNYIFMRPGRHEKTLPGEVFHWRSADGSNEILTARIPDQYTSQPGNLLSHIRKVIDGADRNLGHALLFVGFGDHGAGPTRTEIEMLQEHWDDWKDEGVQLQYSHPDAFFAAIRRDVPMETLPVVQGELQFHAIGCYSAISRIKRDYRRTEDALAAFGHLLTPARRTQCWKRLLFASFHDVLAGSCVDSAMGFVYDSLASARNDIELARIAASRRLNLSLPPHSRQHVVVDNLTGKDFDGCCEYEPWLGIQGYCAPRTMDDLRLLDEEGRVMPMQLVSADCLAAIQPHRMLFPITVKAGTRRVLSLDFGNRERFRREKPLPVPTRKACCSPRIVVYKDTTDTWSHGPSGYPADGGVELSVMAEKPVVLFDGPLATEWRYAVTDAARTLRFEVILRKYHHEQGIHLRFTNLTLIPPRSIVKLCLTPPFKATSRRDHVAGGMQPRAMDGREYPFQDVILLGDESSRRQFAVITRECTACDVQPDGAVRLTLLRTPFFCHHDPTPEPAAQSRHAMDQQLTSWNIHLTTDCAPDILANERFNLTEPLTISETTLGMDRYEANKSLNP